MQVALHLVMMVVALLQVNQEPHHQKNERIRTYIPRIFTIAQIAPQLYRPAHTALPLPTLLPIIHPIPNRTMQIPVLQSRYSHTTLGQHTLQHSLMGHTLVPDSLVVKEQMVNGKCRVALLQLAAVLTMVGYGARHITTVI